MASGVGVNKGEALPEHTRRYLLWTGATGPTLQLDINATSGFGQGSGAFVGTPGTSLHKLLGAEKVGRIAIEEVTGTVAPVAVRK